MDKSIIKVDEMSCDHCVEAITKAVGELPGAPNVSVDSKAKTVTVAYDPSQSPLDRIISEIEDQGYEIMIMV